MERLSGAADSDFDDLRTHQRPLDGEYGHDGPANHLALIYETREEQFATAVPFVRAGLERGERCLYVVDDNATADVIEAMEAAGVDVAAARSTGQLSFHAAEETYLSDGTFDPEDTVAYLNDTVSNAVESDGFDHVRFAGEMTWALDGADGLVHEALAEYESVVNDFYPGAAFTGLCQYNRERFPPGVLQDVLRTHPSIVSDETVCPNVFYVPPAEFLDGGVSAATMERHLRTVRDRHERMARFRDLGKLVRNTVASMTSASSRESIDRDVCDHLTDVESWRFAWVGETSATSDRVTERASAGDGSAYLDDVTVPATGDAASEPTGRATATGSVQVVDDVASAPETADWRDVALERGFRSVASAPLVYEGVSYGVVSVYGDEPGAFGDQAQAALGELGHAVAFACNALERRRALVSDRATELDLRLPAEDPFLDFVTRTDAPVTVEGLVPEPGATDGEATQLRVFFTVDEATRETVDAAADSALSSPSFISERDERLSYDGVVDGDGLLGTLLDHAGVPKSVTPNDANGRVVVRLPPSTDVASFVEMLQDRYPRTELVARREVESEPDTRGDFRSNLKERLTERQWDALQTAYLSGYFEWPRERSGEEVGDRLDVSQPTFNRHLRDSLRKLLRPIFDDENGADR